MQEEIVEWGVNVGRRMPDEFGHVALREREADRFIVPQAIRAEMIEPKGEPCEENDPRKNWETSNPLHNASYINTG